MRLWQAMPVISAEFLVRECFVLISTSSPSQPRHTCTHVLTRLSQSVHVVAVFLPYVFIPQYTSAMLFQIIQFHQFSLSTFRRIDSLSITLSIERNPFSAKNQVLRSYRVYISPISYVSFFTILYCLDFYRFF